MEPLQEYILLLLADSNLPTGGFVASSGLESYVQHGHMTTSNLVNKTEDLLGFIKNSLHSYASLNLPFFTKIHQTVWTLRSLDSPTESVYKQIKEQDDLYDSMILGAIPRRASVAQGIALFTLYERALLDDNDQKYHFNQLSKTLRAGIKENAIAGHLVTGMAFLTSSLGLPLASSKRLFLFLHCRSILSSAVRMNVIGPYHSHKLLHQNTEPLIEVLMDAKTVEEEPVTTWPLGEILASRHDLLHSKIFNS